MPGTCPRMLCVVLQHQAVRSRRVYSKVRFGIDIRMYQNVFPGPSNLDHDWQTNGNYLSEATAIQFNLITCRQLHWSEAITGAILPLSYKRNTKGIHKGTQGIHIQREDDSPCVILQGVVYESGNVACSGFNVVSAWPSIQSQRSRAHFRDRNQKHVWASVIG